MVLLVCVFCVCVCFGVCRVVILCVNVFLFVNCATSAALRLVGPLQSCARDKAVIVRSRVHPVRCQSVSVGLRDQHADHVCGVTASSNMPTTIQCMHCDTVHSTSESIHDHRYSPVYTDALEYLTEW